MPESFRKSTVSILTVDGRRDADAWILPSFPAVAVTRSVWGHTWLLTHVASGRSMSVATDNLRSAKERCRRLAVIMAGADIPNDPDGAARAFMDRPAAYSVIMNRKPLTPGSV